MPLFNLASSAQWCAMRDMEHDADSVHQDSFGVNPCERSLVFLLGDILRAMSP
jgi:hypothetical protein